MKPVKKHNKSAAIIGPLGLLCLLVILNTLDIGPLNLFKYNISESALSSKIFQYWPEAEILYDYNAAGGRLFVFLENSQKHPEAVFFPKAPFRNSYMLLMSKYKEPLQASVLNEGFPAVRAFSGISKKYTFTINETGAEIMSAKKPDPALAAGFTKPTHIVFSCVLAAAYLTAVIIVLIKRDGKLYVSR